MPWSSMPEGVSSMFSVAETSWTPALMRWRRMSTSSSRLRANRSTLCTMQYVTRWVAM